MFFSILILILLIGFCVCSFDFENDELSSEFGLDFIRNFNSMSMSQRRQLLARQKTVQREDEALRDELRFVVQWQYTRIACLNETFVQRRLEELNERVETSTRRTNMLKQMLKASKPLPQQSSVSTQIKNELQYRLDYKSRLAKLIENSQWKPKFEYQKKLLDENYRNEMQKILQQ